MPRRRVDRTGETHGRLTVIEDSDTGKNPKIRCRCACGRVVTVLKHNVLRGNTTSCGCARSEAVRKRMTGRGRTRPATKEDVPSLREALRGDFDPMYWDDGSTPW